MLRNQINQKLKRMVEAREYVIYSNNHASTHEIHWIRCVGVAHVSFIPRVFMKYVSFSRLETSLECTLWTEQCNNLPRSSMDETMVLVVVASSSFRFLMA